MHEVRSVKGYTFIVLEKASLLSSMLCHCAVSYVMLPMHQLHGIVQCMLSRKHKTLFGVLIYKFVVNLSDRLPSRTHQRRRHWSLNVLYALHQAHPPIHPTKHTAGESNWDRDKTRLYEFVVRSFLATCSKPAVGFETKIEIDVAGEGFSTTGKWSGMMFMWQKQLLSLPFATLAKHCLHISSKTCCSHMHFHVSLSMWIASAFVLLVHVHVHAFTQWKYIL